MNIITYEQRVSQMQKPGDENRQLQLARHYVLRLRRKMKKAESMAEKLEINGALKEAEIVLRKLRLNIFSLGEMLEEKIHA